jgi:predicted membrane-bound mannosyltransferase
MILMATVLVAGVHGLGGPALVTGQEWLYRREVLPEQFIYFLATRYLVALIGLATIVVVYLVAARLRGRAAGLLAAAALAVAPLHIENSRYATTDVPVALAVAIALLVTIRAVGDGRDRWWVAAGIAAGLAGSTKWNGLVVVAVPLLACLLATGRPTDLVGFARRRTPWLIGAAAGLTVLVVTPGLVLEPGLVLRAFLQLRRQYAAALPSDASSIATAAGDLASGLGPIALAVAIAGLVVLLAGRRPTGVPLVGFAIGYFAIVGLTPLQFSRNLVPLLPVLAVAAGVGAAGAGTWIARHLARALPQAGLRARPIVTLAPPVILAVALLLGTVALANSAWQPAALDTRTIAFDWIRTNIPAGSRIAREVYTPQLGPEYQGRALFYLNELSLADYRGLGIRFLIASESAYARFLVPGTSPPAGEFYAQLFQLPEVGRIEPGPGRQGPLIRIFELPAS